MVLHIGLIMIIHLPHHGPPGPHTLAHSWSSLLAHFRLVHGPPGAFPGPPGSHWPILGPPWSLPGLAPSWSPLSLVSPWPPPPGPLLAWPHPGLLGFFGPPIPLAPLAYPVSPWFQAPHAPLGNALEEYGASFEAKLWEGARCIDFQSGFPRPTVLDGTRKFYTPHHGQRFYFG